jgi:uncharacterized phage protein (TIGR01671 family)
MREIKFRAWHTEQKKMYSAEEMAEDQLTLLPTGKFINVHGNSKLSRIYDFMIPLQFIGKHDKNGKEIYEGDVIRLGDDTYDLYRNPGDISLVEWDDTETGFTPFCNAHSDYDSINPDTCEIIGNVHENPELVS